MGFRRSAVFVGAAALGLAGMFASPDVGRVAPLPSRVVMPAPPRDRRRKKKGPAPKPMNRKHLGPQSAFMRQLAEERAIGVHPKYRHAAARRRGPTPAEWEDMRRQWLEQNPIGGRA